MISKCKYYDKIMEILESESPIRYYRCGRCGGPVAYGHCCPWCAATDPMTTIEAEEGKE